MKQNHGHKGLEAKKREKLVNTGMACMMKPKYSPEKAAEKAGIP